MEWRAKKRSCYVILSFNPRVTDHYTKPINGGKKSSGNVWKRPVTEPIIIEEGVKTTTDNAALTPLENINAPK